MTKKHLQSLFSLGLIIGLFIACDNEFVELDSDLINREIASNINIDSIEYEVIAYTLPLGPVQTNNLTLNHVGRYTDNTYGDSDYTFLSRVSPSEFDPEFGDNVRVDSVIFYVPYFNRSTGVDDNGFFTYELDSIYGDDPMQFEIFENEFFIRTTDPDGGFGEPQEYYSNKSLSESEFISDELLESTLIHVDTNFRVSSDPYILTDEEDEIIQILPPGIRFKLDEEYWIDKIISKQGQDELANANAFNNYFRGLYLKAEPINNKGTLVGIDLSGTISSVIIYYTDIQEDPENSVQETYEINMTGYRANFIENSFTGSIPVGDPVIGDENLYLKGGEGSLAGFELFPGEDSNDESVFEEFKNDFANYVDGEFESSKRLINEANIILFVQQELVEDNEPDRIYLYDLDNAQPLIDYATDVVSQTFPRISISSHLGVLERDDSESEEGIRYVMRVTGHINNLIQSDSTNVRLGLAVSANVNVEGASNQRNVQAIEDSEDLVPLSSVISPRGTVIHGNLSEETEKRLRLKIFYTCIDTFEDCDN